MTICTLQLIKIKSEEIKKCEFMEMNVCEYNIGIDSLYNVNVLSYNIFSNIRKSLYNIQFDN